MPEIRSMRECLHHSGDGSYFKESCDNHKNTSSGKEPCGTDKGKVDIVGDSERPCGLSRHILYLARHCPLADGLSGKILEGYDWENIWSDYRCLLYTFFHHSIRHDHEQLVGHMRMSLYTSRCRERQCSRFTTRARIGLSSRAPIEIFFTQGHLPNATFGVLDKKSP